MSAHDAEDTRSRVVPVNHEEQYSPWLRGKDVPLGWSVVGQPGSREECLTCVREVWTDMRPLNLRGRSEAAA